MKNYYIGIDLGTSSVKVLLLSDFTVEKTVTREYPLSFPQPGWSEQDPYDWIRETTDALQELTSHVDASCIRSISFSGQMHGLVLLDEQNTVIRPAILWNDGRTQEETDYLNETVGKDFLLDHTGNIAFAGFTAPKVLWVKKHEPENFARIHKILLPKDYLAFWLTGQYSTDVSDASGTLYFDVEKRDWSPEILEVLGITREQLPEVHESSDCVGTLTATAAATLGLPASIKVMAGAGDNAAAAVGTGTVNSGDCNLSLGTSGTIFVVSDRYSCDRENAIHHFCSASDSWHYMACMLSAASCSHWWTEDILGTKDYALAENASPAETGLYFLPYLMGERSPLNDANARGLFYGMTMGTTKADMSLAVLEGVSFAFRQNLDLIRAHGLEVTQSMVCGGGANNELWMKILASILNVTLLVPNQKDSAALGAALIGAKGCMDPDQYDAMAEYMCSIANMVQPAPELAAKYEAVYQNWLRLYPALKTI